MRESSHVTAGEGKFSRDRRRAEGFRDARRGKVFTRPPAREGKYSRRGKVFELRPRWGGKVFAAGESFRAEAPLGRESIRGGGKFRAEAPLGRESIRGGGKYSRRGKVFTGICQTKSGTLISTLLYQAWDLDFYTALTGPL